MKKCYILIFLLIAFNIIIAQDEQNSFNEIDFYDAMCEKVINTKNLFIKIRQYSESSDSRYSQKDKFITYWQNEKNQLRVEIRDSSGKYGGNIIDDGHALWVYWLQKGCPNIYPANFISPNPEAYHYYKKDAANYSLKHQFSYLGATFSNTFINCLKYRKFQQDPYLDSAYYLKNEVFKNQNCKIIQFSYKDGQDILNFWISEKDTLLYKIERILKFNNQVLNNIEEWQIQKNHILFNDSLFSFNLPDDRIEYIFKDPSDRITITPNSINISESLIEIFSAQKIDSFKFNNKKILINFWRLGCPPCRKEIVFLNEQYENFRKNGYEIISMNFVDDIALIEQYYSDNKIKFLFINDFSGKVESLFMNLADKFGSLAVPLNVLIDENGFIIEAWYGFSGPNSTLRKMMGN